MSKRTWRVSPFVSDAPINIRARKDIHTSLKRAFPDVEKMPVSKRLKEWGIDVSNIDFVITSLPGPVMSSMALNEGVIFMDHDAPLLIGDYLPPKKRDEELYLVLSHELGHLLQHVEGVHPGYTPHSSIDDWFHLNVEANSIRWSARQAKAMGMSEKEFLDAEERMRPKHRRITRAIVHPVFTEKWPEERGVRPMFTGPVRVRSYKRLKRRFK
jgi:predicted SprT family Zn-dependent metalloprotease